MPAERYPILEFDPAPDAILNPRPVRDGQALTALRLCVGARDISAATAGARGTAEALTQARLALDKLAWLISRL